MTLPLYLAKAELFKTLAHPTRIRVLELLAEREYAVGELLHKTDVRAARLWRQLVVLRRAGLVVSRKEGSARYYSLTSPRIAELLLVARHVVTDARTGQVGQRQPADRDRTNSKLESDASPALDSVGTSKRSERVESDAN
ncbi:MAG TPA: metalloregulator ArsR/SmtB family transcription factor [Micromonosporaceae bacterium]|nr:metalloregulator ArsR/SmtB family transcription factor [Micromonosporaceae bacterium]